jgi:glycine dehydrogenase subunit 1
MYLASLGGSGIRELAQLNHDKSEYLKGRLQEAGCGIPFDSPTFNEFVVQFPAGFKNTYNRLLNKKIVAGLPLVSHYPDMNEHYLLCVTETMSKADMDALIEEIQP